MDVEFGTDEGGGASLPWRSTCRPCRATSDSGVRSRVTDALSTTVTIDGSDVVTWDDECLTIARTEYAPLTVTGTAGSGANSQRVVARYEVIPQELVYCPRLRHGWRGLPVLGGEERLRAVAMEGEARARNADQWAGL